jgi:small subunit ribosomal protein S8
MYWIGDGLARIKNAIAIRKPCVIVRGTKVFLSILDVMQREGFISSYEAIESVKLKQSYSIKLAYKGRKSVICGIKLISKPSLPVYVGAQDLRAYLSRFSIPIVSTSSGVISGRDALQRNLGGQLICEVF